MAETSLGILMKEIGEALRLDNDNFDKEAYVKYTSCIYKIAGNLTLGVNLSGGNVMIGPKTCRQVKLLQQCVERVVELVSRMGTSSSSSPILPHANYPSTPTTPVSNRPRDVEDSSTSKSMVSASEKGEGTSCTLSPQAYVRHATHDDSRPTSFQSPIPALSVENNLSLKQRPTTMSPMQIARKQNQSLLVAYKARMKRLNRADFSAFNYSLTIQRRMAENLAIAQAQEVELAKKMQARQQRLEEEAARRFSLPTGLSSEEQEQRQIYKNILMYENEMESLQVWRKRLENNPEDPILICQVVQEVLQCSDHPLTEMLRKYQFKIYERLYPLVANKHRFIDMVEVGLPEHLWPSLEDIADIMKSSLRESSPTSPEIPKKKKSRTHSGRSESEKDGNRKDGKETESSSGVSEDSNCTADMTSQMTDLNERDGIHEKENIGENEVTSNTVERTISWDDLLQARSHYKSSTKVISDSEDKNNTESEGKSDNENNSSTFVPSDNNTNTSFEGEDKKSQDKTDIESPTSSDVISTDDETETEKRDFKSEDEKEKQDEDGLTKDESRSAEDVDDDSDTNTLTSASESDSGSDVDASTNEMDDVTKTVSATKHNLAKAIEKGKQLESELTFQRKQAQHLMRQVTKDYENYNDENFDDLFEDEEEEEEIEVRAESFFEKNKPTNSLSFDQSSQAFRITTSEKSGNIVLDRSQSMQPVHVDTPTEPPSAMFHSLPFMPVSEHGKEEEDQNPFLTKMTTEAYSRHLQAISRDIHSYLDKLLVLMIIAYEVLDTPVGKDQCAVALEEPFFKPIWKLLFRLYRVVYHKQELTAACVMTKYADASPEDLNISKKFWLLDESDLITPQQPYQSAIEELKFLTQHYTVVSKLESLVKVCRLICECVDKYYGDKNGDGDVTTPRKAPSLGADDLLPVFNYVVIRSKNPQVVSDCYAMMEFIQESYMMGEEGYCLTTLRTAIAYLISLYKDIV